MKKADVSIQLNKKVIILAMVAAFGFGFYQGAQMLSYVVGHYTSNPFSLVGLLIEGGIYLVVALLSWRGRGERPKWLYVIGAILGVLFVFVALVNDQQPLFQLLFRAIASTSAACLLLCWAYVFSVLPPLLSAVSISSAFLISALVKLLSSPLVASGSDESLYLQLLIFICCLVLLFVAIRQTGMISMKDSPEREKASGTTRVATPQRLRRLFVGAAAFSVTYGMVLQSDIEMGVSQYAQSDLMALLTFFFAGAVLLLSLLGSFKGNINYLFVIIAPCFGVAILLKGAFDAGSSIGGAINTAVLNLYYMVLWITLAKESHLRQYPAFFLFGIGLGVSRAALLCGRGIALGFAQYFAVSWAGVELVSGIALWVMLCAGCLFIVSIEKERESSPMQAAASLMEDEDAESPWIVLPETTEGGVGAAWERLAEQKGLSAREAEILFEFLQGRSSSYIADLFFISEHTVKTHIRRGYEKLGIHSRQDLISLVQSDMRS